MSTGLLRKELGKSAEQVEKAVAHLRSTYKVRSHIARAGQKKSTKHYVIKDEDIDEKFMAGIVENIEEDQEEPEEDPQEGTFGEVAELCK